MKYSPLKPSDLWIIPYVQLDDGAWSIPDDSVVTLWTKLAEQNLLEMVWTMTPVDTAERLLSLMQNKSHQFHLVATPQEIAGVAWLSNFGHNSAAANFCVFREFWGKNALILAKHSLDYWFSFQVDGKPLLKVIFGQTPEHNRLATMFLRRIGMKVLGTIPYMGYDPYEDRDVGLVISYITRG